MAEFHPWAAILIERRPYAPPFDTHHPFEDERDRYEREILLEGGEHPFSEVAETRSYDRVTGESCVRDLGEIAPDAIIVFGTGKIPPGVIRSARIACLNLHGGNPEQYRGLDTHLWAIYHQDFGNLITTLHSVDSGLDTGDIVFQTKLALTRGTRLSRLRSVNTGACIDLTRLAFHSLGTTGKLPSRPLATIGRYYSSMPRILKEICLQRFDRYVASL
jgi:hypothetical protein